MHLLFLSFYYYVVTASDEKASKVVEKRKFLAQATQNNKKMLFSDKERLKTLKKSIDEAICNYEICKKHVLEAKSKMEIEKEKLYDFNLSEDDRQSLYSRLLRMADDLGRKMHATAKCKSELDAMESSYRQSVQDLSPKNLASNDGSKN